MPMKSAPFLTADTDGDRSQPDSARGTLTNPRRADDGRLLSCEHQVQRRARYSGLLENMSAEEVRVLLVEAWDYAEIGGTDWPLPPAGLPGVRNDGYDRHCAEADIIEIGIGYVRAVINNERRAMHLRWQEAGDIKRRFEFEKLLALEAEQVDTAVFTYENKEPAQRVYFIASTSGPIKIGVANSPKNRLKSLQTGHHERLTLLATCDGGMERERAYHVRFADHRLHGEWFARAPEIEAEILMLAKGE